MNESQPSQNQLDVMRYADGELPANEAQSMEQRLATDPSLRRELAAYQTLEVLARNTAPPEPGDLEWQQLRSGTLHRGVGLVSWLLIGVSSLGYFSWVLAALFGWTDTPHPAIFGIGAVGLILLTLMLLRERVAALPLDPYRKVKR